ncbi:MAG: M20 aminoacylase family protein [Lautropia sp.]|nr:M20 aminoacylase family protein [Lautropia sp.]
MRIHPDILAQFPEFKALRRDIHAHPELGYEEQRTSALVAERLRSWGYEVTTGLAGTGVVGTLRRGNSPRAIGIRADMDALPMHEVNDFPHRSQNPGRMHACGHDGHTTMLLAAARHLSEHPDFDGTVHLIFQPAEEGGGGGRRMIEDGLFERFHCDAVFGAHNWPGMPVGTVGLRAGPLMGSSNEFEVTIRGRGAHAALPQNGIDPVLIATHLVQAFQSIISRNRNPVEAAVLSVTQIHAGETSNVIPDTAVVSGTVRTFSLEMLDLIESRMKQLSEHICAGFGATADFHFHRNYPPTLNDPEQTAFAARVIADVIGPQNLINPIEPTMGAEDFSFMLLERPGCYFFLGNGDGKHRETGHGAGPCLLHNTSYDFNDELIPIGATLWMALIRAFLPQS